MDTDAMMALPVDLSSAPFWRMIASTG